jgi:hypothetical protein
MAIIAEHSSPTRVFRLPALVTLGLVLIAGSAAALHYAGLDLTLSHYDARGHLMVARRVIDNLTPGWMQLGAVWLPLPHLLNALPAQWDWQYRTGASGVVLSILPLSIGLAALGGYLAQRTRSMVVGVAVPLAVLLNPNVLYLQSTPMTEPLLFGLSCLALVLMDRWIEAPTSSAQRSAGVALVALMLTRYEGWCITGALVGLAFLAHPARTLRLAVYPAAAVVGFLLLSYGSTGAWFVTSGFFEANNPALGRPWLAVEQVLEAATRLSSSALVWIGALGVCGAVAAAWTERAAGRQAVVRALLPLALVAAVALPVYAFTSGHPVRVRYMVSLVVALTVLSAFALRWMPAPVRAAGAGAFLALMLWTAPPLDAEAPMVREAQWERPYSDARRVVTAALAERWDGSAVMASMGSLGHYMQQMSHAGFNLRDFLHEGNGTMWRSAEQHPARYVRWMLIEESAEGGDVLAQRARTSPDFLSGFTRIAEGGGVALYERTSRPRTESGNRP